MTCTFSLNIFTVPYACWTFLNGIEVAILAGIGYGIFYWFVTRK
jgi:hypothetical protein